MGIRVSLFAEKTENGARIRFARLEGLAEAQLDTFPVKW